jgi:hypothetical protein
MCTLIDIQGFYNDIWRSDDLGATWLLVAISSRWSPRYLHTAVAMGTDAIFLSGGIVNSVNGKLFFAF